MNDKSSGRQTLEIMVVSTVIGFVGWLVLLFVIWQMLQGAGVKVNYWAMVEALSTAVTAAALIGGGFVAYRQLDEGANTRYMDVADRLFGELNSQQNIEARRWIFQELPDDPEELQTLTAEGQANVKRTLNSLDRVAFLTRKGWIPKNIVMPWMNPMIVKSWMKLKPYVEREREVRGEPDYYEHAGQLGEECIKWRAAKLEGAEIKWVEDAL